MTPDAGKCHQLKQMATAYFEQYNRQSIPDFHGLRDYYALISNLRLHPQLSPEQLYRALLRNFGGPAEVTRQVRARMRWTHPCLLVQCQTASCWLWVVMGAEPELQLMLSDKAFR